MIFDPYESHKLTGKHAALYRESLGTMVDVFRESRAEGDEDYISIWSFGVTLFDTLRWRQQLALLLSVSQCVLNGSGDPEKWDALEKAAFYAVYRNVLTHLEIERDMDCMEASGRGFSFPDDDPDLADLDDCDEEEEERDGNEQSWHELIVGAYQEKCLQEGLSPQEIERYLHYESDNNGDLHHWHSLLERLADQILDDRDFEMASTLMDADPEIASVIKMQLGIPRDYFLSTAAEPNDAAVEQMFRDLILLAGLRFGVGEEGDDAPF
ncbi:hypothetical protein [Stieleria mannarensis]|uniref:hypothetical protein n=1 Tax=Stieleria mannarensis TaxID=2755585 RepID=UPI0016015B3A|nr:hypothetical protein [Rhodopirellula sp. JC639]